MAKEIEHKFLVRDDRWRDQVFRSTTLRQGYLVSDETRSVRVRVAGDKAYLNIKSATVGISRNEYEYPIPVPEAEEILAHLCLPSIVEKTRHLVRYGDHVWEIDVFEGDNTGLIVAEVELASADEAFERPPWVGDDVSHDLRYYNSYLAQCPYKDW
ncbi:MAG: CYTH domain-containing protein [Candidatus Competibacteraceae bacterium]|jgi:adenylate cyclase|nr:CYTH domain-containing protein [Candidatus Competibacteraceae bacterium]